MDEFGNAGHAVRPRFSAVQVALAIVGTVVAAWVLSFVYGVAEHYSPLIYLNLILAFGFGWLVGVVARTMLRKYRIDSPAAATLIGVVGGVAATYLAWPAYLYVITDYNFSIYTGTIASPLDIWEIMGMIAEDPMWSIGKSSGTMPAVIYFAVWLGELILITGAATQVCRTFVRDNRLCSKCGDWVTATGDLAMFAIPAEGGLELLAAMENGDASALANARHLRGDADHADQWLEVQGFACSQCDDEDSYATISLVMMQPNKKKKNELERSQKVLARLVPVDLELEKKIFEPEPESEPAPAAEPEPAPAQADVANEPEKE